MHKAWASFFQGSGSGGGGGADADAPFVTMTYAATTTPDQTGNNRNFDVTLTGNVTLGNFANIADGSSGAIKIIQGGAGSFTLTLDTNYDSPGGTGFTLSTAIGAVDILTYYVDGTTIHVGIQLDSK